MMRADRKSQGLTLIELVVTIAVLGIVVVAVPAMFETVKNINRAANNLTIATEVAQQELELYRNTPYSSLADGTQDISSALTPYPSLSSPRTATATISTTDPHGLKRIDIAISYKGLGGTKNVQVSTLVSYRGINR